MLHLICKKKEMTIIVNLETAIQELNNGTIEFHYSNNNGCTTEGEIVTFLNRLQQYENSGFPLEALNATHNITEPITVKDFKANNIAYVVYTPTYRDINYHINEVTITKVGRKYVQVGPYSKYEQADWYKYGLVQSESLRDILLPTKEAAERYIEHCKLNIWFSAIKTRTKNYTLEQLRLIKQILEPNEME